MDLRYTPEDIEYRKQVRSWLEDHLPEKKLESLQERRTWHTQMFDAGFIGMGWPKEYGGQAARPMEQAIVGEELARANAPQGVGGLGIAIVGPTLIHHGTEDQKQRYLKNILNGDEIWCQLYSEPNAGSDLANLQCRADIDGDTFIVNGQKIWTSGAHNADWGLMLARTDRRATKHAGISCIMVDMNSSGVEVRPLKQISGSSEFSEVFFSDVVVPADNLIGELNTGWRIAQTTLSYERGGNMLSRVTRLQVAFDRLLEVANEPRADGTRMIDNLVTRQKLGQMYAEMEVLRYSSLRLLSKLEKGERPGPEASVSKLHYSELDKRVQEMIQDILGPFGQQISGAPESIAFDDTAVDYGGDETWAYQFVWSRAGTIYAGSSQVQKNIIGERVLGLPKEIRADRIELEERKKAEAAADGGDD